MQIPGYRIIRKINQGGMATVYLAIQTSVNREVALKIMSPALNADPVFSERFQREATIVGQLSHPHIVSIYDIGQHKNLNYIAMDYLAGGSVHDKMSSGLSTTEALRITREIANALDHAHEKGYIHRDIKPENILFREDGTAILSDFGVAKTLTGASKMTNAGTVVGTPHYMSPEQARGKPVDGRSDLYSLGIVLYEMLTGSVPFQAEEAVAIAIKHLTAPIPKLPPQQSILQPLLNKMLAKDSDDRFQRGSEVAAAIDALQGNRTTGNPRYLTETEPSAVQVVSLLNALLTTTWAVLTIRIRNPITWLLRWRWDREQGFYQRPPSSVEPALDADQDRETVIATASRYDLEAIPQQSERNKRMAWLLTALVAVGTTLWLGFADDDAQTSEPQQAVIDTDNPRGLATSEAKTPDAIVEDSDDQSLQEDELIIIDSTSVGETAPEPVSEPEPTEPPPPPPPPRYALGVSAQPVGARIRILNITEKYYPGIPLLPGEYHVEVSQRGYDTFKTWVTVTDQDLQLAYELKKTPVPGATFSNQLNDGTQGPTMVIIPAGKFTMGHQGASTTSPTTQIRIRYPFAVSQYEITFADFDKFAKATDRVVPKDNRWGRGSRPVINISWQDAQAYTDWLRKSTGRKYRLLTEAEWEYVARAGTNGDYWWPGNSDQGAGKKAEKAPANCRRGCDGKFSNLFRTKTAPVGTYQSNPFKVFDTAGNVAEWVRDCYQDHYLNLPRDGTARPMASCSLKSVRGGSVKSTLEELKTYSRDKRDPLKGYTDVGFRVLVELY
ncbi:SUMF1/EgtB/PvdO family nonheme iron enzyme [Pseudomaricurvus alkylphenolicus]|uniref:bifunctional serine/threonine-protein kinase/formylglycine-generating enzyme family protein n=1 Tax=Pseudomaricurvus alkylphenolicus TaxID=1306991 RepID=UPI0014244BAA|nr:bifunctional serine/threonine-protein kinase/formylglycine-generating enzyme family protein [Pseudomaricurvus alkylphenolicus]NIB44555.1 SUMF1/EgtB/PvdO family nonheme iron enzyme [Pseudomaricurvus alkylphenolicus]